MISYYDETDVIEVTNPPVLIYGTPSAGKTSLAQTATNPFTLDFDKGIHRSAFRKRSLGFDSWEEVLKVQREGYTDARGRRVEPGFANFETIVLDTVGTCLDFLAANIVNSGVQGVRTKAGSLSLTGWGALKEGFRQWLSGLRQAGKQVIMTAHQREEGDGETKTLRPDISGGSYGIVMNCADLVGYISYRNNVRFLSWEPCDAYFAKNGAGLKSGPVPDFAASPAFMADLLVQAKANLGRTARASAEIAKVVEEWKVNLDNLDDLEALNRILPELSKLGRTEKVQAWALVLQTAERHSWTFDKPTKVFLPNPASNPKLAAGIGGAA